jgi:hypothetical protein
MRRPRANTTPDRAGPLLLDQSATTADEFECIEDRKFPLRHVMDGCWSRRIEEHRLVYLNKTTMLSYSKRDFTTEISGGMHHAKKFNQ